MRLTIEAIGTVLLLVAIGLSIARTGHPKAVAPVMAGLVGILVIVGGLVINRASPRSRPTAHQTPAPAVTIYTQAPQAPAATTAACSLRLPMSANAPLPGPR